MKTRKKARDLTPSEEASKYARDILSGELPACKWVKLACQRHLDDLEKAKTEWPYRYDPQKGDEICNFITCFPNIKGKWGGTPLVLRPWQCFILCSVFGWIKKSSDLRRFRTAYLEMPRKQGKSTLSSGVGLYMLTQDGEPGADVYSAATTREQARIVFSDAQQMARRTQEFRDHYGAQVNAHNINVLATGSKFEALSSDAHSLDGLNVHCGIIDELHAHKTREVWDVIETATGARQQPLIWAITTAGFNQVGICYEQRTYVTKLLEGIFQDETYFGIIFTIDEGDAWDCEDSWRKANPNYGFSVNPEDIARKARKAAQLPSAVNNFLTKHLDVWVSAETAYFNMEAWRKRCTSQVKLDEFEGKPCWIGLDLSAKTDLTAAVLLFRRDEESGAHYYAFARNYLPEDVVEQGLNTNCSHYAGWSREDRLILTDGAAIDLDRVEDDVREDLRRFDVQAVCYDPWNCAQMAGHLTSEGAPMVENRMGVQTMSEPMKMLDALILEGRIHHDGDPVLAWNISNVVGKLDNKDNVYPRKERPENKIDGAVALMMALGAALRQEDTTSVYQTRGVLVI